MLSVLAHLDAVVVNTQVHEVELVAEHFLWHVLVSLPVTRDNIVPFLLETLREVTRNETTCSSNTDLQLLIRPVRLKRILEANEEEETEDR